VSTLRVLIVEDSQEDAVLIERAVASAGHEVESRFVLDGDGLLSALAGPLPDFVLVGCLLLDARGSEMLAIVRNRLPEVPVIAISGSIGEDRVADLLRAGVSDFVLKSRLDRLGPAIARELVGVRSRTDLQEGKQRQAESEGHYRRMVETANEGVWELDTQLHTTFVNRRMAKMLGFEPGEMLGRAIQSFLYPDELAEHADCMNGRRQGEADRCERRFICKNGDELWALVAVTPILNPDGTFRGSFAILTDITESKRRERELRESRAKYRAIFEEAPLGVFRSAPDGQYLEVNPAFARMVGYDSPEEMMRVVKDIGHQLYLHASDRERVTATLLAGGEIRGWEVEVRGVDGQRLWVAINARSVRAPGGQVVEFEGTAQDVTQRRQFSEALQESEEKHRLLVESANEAIYIAQDGVLRFVNSRMCELSGFTREELIGRAFAELIYPEDRSLVTEHHQRRLAGDEVPELCDFRFVTKSGEVRWAQNNGVDVAWQGRPATLNFSLDVTERRFLEKESELKSAALDAAANAILIVNQAGIVLWVNSAFSHMTGFEFGDVVGRPLREIQLDQPDSGGDLDIWTAMAAGRVWHGVGPARRRDGTRYLEATTLTPVTDAGGAVTHFVAIKDDVTERYHAAEQQHAQLELLRTLMDAMPSPVFHKDLEGRYRGCNPAFAAFVGRPLEDVIGHTVYDLWRRDLAETYAARDRELLDRGGAQVYEGRVERSDGKVRDVVFSKACFHSSDGSLAGLVGVIVDVTEQIQLQQQLYQAQKAEVIGRLAGGVAHDFNNVLQAMMSLAQVLSLTERDAKRLGRLKELEEHIRRGAQVTRQLLLFSRREMVKLERLDLEEVVTATARLLRRLLRENVLLQVEQTGDPIPVLADRSQVEQVVVNLALNGADAMPTGGRLLVRTQVRADGAALLEVEDAGSGIAEDIRSRIFEPFFTTKGHGRGSGLGLSVVEGIVSQIGGSIELETEVGRGSLFRVVLPRIEEPLARGDGPVLQAEDGVAMGHGERVLVIEDEPGARDGLAETLTHLGYTVTTAASGEEALGLPAEPPMAAVVSDIVLPGRDGADVVRRLHDRWQGLVAILMSGYTDDQTVQRQAMDGSIRFLQKPFDTSQIAGELAAALAERREGSGRGC